MPNCKFCGKPVTCANIFHSSCWETAAKRMAGMFCDEYCRFPREGLTEDEFQRHCDGCALVRLLNLGL